MCFKTNVNIRKRLFLSRYVRPYMPPPLPNRDLNTVFPLIERQPLFERHPLLERQSGGRLRNRTTASI